MRMRVKKMWGVPNYHLKTTLSTFGGSIFSGTKLKANTKMETDVETSKSCSARLYIPCFHLFSLSLPLYPLRWPNITSGGWKNKSKTVFILCCEVSDQTQPITMNLQWTAGNFARWLSKRSEGTKNIDKDQVMCFAEPIAAYDHGKWFPIRLTQFNTAERLSKMLIFRWCQVLRIYIWKPQFCHFFWLEISKSLGVLKSGLSMECVGKYM